MMKGSYSNPGEIILVSKFRKCHEETKEALKYKSVALIIYAL